MRFAEITRGSYKVYYRIDTNDVPKTSRFAVASSTLSGEPLPSKIVSIPGVEGRVVIVPALLVAQKITVCATAESGEVLESISTSLSAYRAKATSMFNTATHNEVANAIRNCDEGRYPRVPRIKPVRVVAVGPEDILQLSVTLLGRSREDISGEVSLNILNRQGELASLGESICLGDQTTHDNTVDDGFLMRTLLFSARIPVGIKGIVVWVAVGNELQRDSFECYTSEFIDHYRGLWLERTFPARSEGAYDGWLRTVRPSEKSLQKQRERVFALTPKFSIVVPLYKTPRGFFCEMADSVLAQTYANYELVLVNASPEDAELQALVEDYLERDSRIKEVKLDDNLGITENTNAGIKAATGDFLCFFDHDDVIEPDLLYWYTDGINRYPETDLLYCDEDKLVDGHYIEPYFKPDWDPDLLCGCNYVTHLLTVRKSIVDGMEPPTKEFDGSQDLYMTHRVGARARNVFHARRILYHWRVHPLSAAAGADAKPYTTIAGVRGLQKLLDYKGINAIAKPDEKTPNTYWIDFTFDDYPLVTLVAVAQDDDIDSLAQLRRMLAHTSYPNLEVVFVGSSTQGNPHGGQLDSDEHIRWISDPSDGTSYAMAANEGVRQAEGDYVILTKVGLEPIFDNWVQRLLGYCQREDVGAVGAKLLLHDKTVYDIGYALTSGGPMKLGLFLPSSTETYYHPFNMAQRLSAISADCCMVRKSRFDEVGGLDDGSFVDELCGPDLCARLTRMGYTILIEPRAALYLGNCSYWQIQGAASTPDHALAYANFIKKWPGLLGGQDHYMNPWFSRDPMGESYLKLREL